MAWIEKRGKKYKVYWDVGDGDNRKRRVESFDTSEDASNFRKKIDYQQSIGIIFDPVKMTVGEYLDHWLEIHKIKLAPKTYASYRCEIENHIKPHLGHIKLLRLTPMQLQNYYTVLQKEGKANILYRKLEKEDLDPRARKRAEKRLKKMTEEGKAGLSGTTVNYHHRIIHKALKQAYKWQMVGQNVADAVETPKKNPTEIEYMKKHQVHHFINAIKGNYDYPVILAAIYTGMRQGELLGLRWQDVDLEAGIIYIQQQAQYLPDQGFYFKDPKQNSKRRIPVPLPLNSALRQVKKEQERYKTIYGEEYKKLDLVFCAPDGGQQEGTALTKRFQALLEQNGLPKMRFHSLRHTFATMCRGAGMSIEDIQDLLGHADISTTKTMYTHIEIEPLKKAMSKLEEYMSN
jgi:integrase